jgi:hypothetical protein
MQAAQKVCAVGAGVSCETLSSFGARVRYITALKAIPTTPNCPLLLKVEDVPAGMPVARLAEIVAMLATPHVRVLIEFAGDAWIPDLNINIQATGIGAALPENCSLVQARDIVSMVSRRTIRQRAFGFVRGLANHAFVELAAQFSVRFGMGHALDDVGGRQRQYTGLERVPEFPLKDSSSQR